MILLSAKSLIEYSMRNTASGAILMEDASFDTVISMNGFHAFPDKEKAFQEIWRVLKSGGTFIACFYIKGVVSITDWLVKTILAKKGWFSLPFRTQEVCLTTKVFERKLDYKPQTNSIDVTTFENYILRIDSLEVW